MLLDCQYGFSIMYASLYLTALLLSDEIQDINNHSTLSRTTVDNLNTMISNAAGYLQTTLDSL